MNQSSKIGLTAVLAVLLLAGGGGYYMWNKPHKDLTDSPADFTLKAEELFQAYYADEASANQTYLNKVVELTGVVMEKQTVEENRSIVLVEVPGEMFGINCAFEAEEADQVNSLKEGQTITLRGEVTGFTMDVNLARCVLMN
ncbi:MAG: OB-fold putative lipoprotein [Bacteroidia bacterium]|nr:OB-fold putative lipoprotein [Bacteroidia bacterium]